MRPMPRFRWAWWLLAYVALGLGLVGMFLPGLPTVPFVLLSAFAAARGSDRLHQRLLADPRFGPMIRDWQAGGTVDRRAKWLATWTMLASAAILVALMLFGGRHGWWLIAVPIGCMTVVAIWLWRRPEPPPRREGAVVDVVKD
ncbi:MAG TPA: YbaN family protein [Luteimonas sp.]|nr:YbaN family protein [Luteimonas sp.]HRP72230.1 YbaN family protein [Luteimonas sp.]